MGSSQVSILWQDKNNALGQELQRYNLSGLKLFGIMIGVVYLLRDDVSTVAFGLLGDRKKKFLVQKLKSSENSRVWIDLLNKLNEHGLSIPQDRY